MKKKLFKNHLSAFKGFISLAAEFAALEAGSRVAQSIGEHSNWKKLPRVQRNDIAVKIDEELTVVLQEWQQILEAKSYGQIDRPTTHFEAWLSLHQDVTKIQFVEAVCRLKQRQGFKKMEPGTYLAMFPDDLRELTMKEVGAIMDEVEIEWRPYAVECFCRRSTDLIEEFTGVRLNPRG